MTVKQHVLILFLLVNVWSTETFAETAVVFDQQTQQLQIQIERWTLEKALKSVAEKTGYMIYTANEIDLSVIVSMRAEGTVHDLLPRLARNYSTVIRETDDQQTKIWILPSGETQSHYLKDGTAVRAIIAETNEEGRGKKRHRRDMSEEEWHQYRKQLKRERKAAREGTQ